MALSAKHSKSVQKMSTEQLQSVVQAGTLLSAAAKAELQKRGVSVRKK